MICRFCKTDSVEYCYLAPWLQPSGRMRTSHCTVCGALNAQVIDHIELDKGENDDAKTEKQIPKHPDGR